MSELMEVQDEYGTAWYRQTTNGRKLVKRETNGIQYMIEGYRTVDIMKATQAYGATLRRNVMNDKINVSDREMSDYDLLLILNRLRDLGFRGETRLQDAIKELAHHNKYHPIKEYLDGLKWDGVSRWDNFVNCLTMQNEIGRVFLRKFLIGTIAKALTGAQNFMLVLVALQGKGKSTLARWLCPLPQYFIEGAIDPSRADDHLRLISAWLWEVAELDATTKRADVAALKHFISQKVVRARAPYARMDTVKEACASLIGTVNPDGTGFLTDTENRRFAIVDLIDIDFAYQEIDLGQFWAELYNAYLNGETWELTQYEKEIQAEINGDYISKTPLEMLFDKKFDIDAESTDEWEVIDIVQVLEGIGLRGEQFRNSMEVGKLLSRRGLVKRRASKPNKEGKRPRMWVGLKLKNEVLDLH